MIEFIFVAGARCVLEGINRYLASLVLLVLSLRECAVVLGKYLLS